MTQADLSQTNLSGVKLEGALFCGNTAGDGIQRIVLEKLIEERTKDLGVSIINSCKVIPFRNWRNTVQWQGYPPFQN